MNEEECYNSLIPSFFGVFLGGRNEEMKAMK